MTRLYDLAARASAMAAVLCAVLALLSSPAMSRADEDPPGDINKCDFKLPTRPCDNMCFQSTDCMGLNLCKNNVQTCVSCVCRLFKDSEGKENCECQVPKK